MIIAVWGSSGSGKSTVSVKLAHELSRRSDTILIDANYITPQMQIWYPFVNVPQGNSLSVVLQNSVSLDSIAPKITMVSPKLGVLGYVKGEQSVNSLFNRDDTVRDLLAEADNMADYIVVDCQTNITQDVLSFMAVERADVKVITLTPDLKGAAWWESNASILTDNWARNRQKALIALSPAQKISPVEQIEKITHGADYYLLDNPQIKSELYSGKLGADEKIRGYSEIIAAMAKEVTENG